MPTVRVDTDAGEIVRVRGLVQGVGFRPTVWRLARRHGLRGWVNNDGDGVMAHVCGASSDIAAFVEDLARGAPPLARIDSIEREAAALLPGVDVFRIVPSSKGGVHTAAVPDAATCEECLREIHEPTARRFQYPFANCTHCGPRLSIIQAIPYDRATTTMRAFTLGAACRGKYEDPSDRRFHAQPEARRQPLKRGVHQRTDHPQRMIRRHHRLRTEIAEHPTRLMIRSAHLTPSSQPLWPQRIKSTRASTSAFFASSLFNVGSHDAPLLGQGALPTSWRFLVRLERGRFFVPA
jgi:acylphosphatase